MIKRFLIISTIFLLTACSNPQNITFGLSPSDDLVKNAEALKKLPPQDLDALTAYVAFAEKSATAGKPNPVTGKKVSDILPDARSWQKVQIAEAVEKHKRDEEQKAAESKRAAEYKLTMERFSSTVKVIFVSRTIIPPELEVVNRPDPIIRLEYNVENRGAKEIMALKGKIVFSDLFSKKIVEHPFQTDKTVPIGAKATFTINYKIVPAWREMANFTNFEDGKYTADFIPEAVSFEGGETLNLLPPTVPIPAPASTAGGAATALPPVLSQ